MYETLDAFLILITLLGFMGIVVGLLVLFDMAARYWCGSEFGPVPTRPRNKSVSECGQAVDTSQMVR